MPATTRLLGLRRFIKGFVPGGRSPVEGYNVSVTGASLSSPWTEQLQGDDRREWARFTVVPVDPQAVDNRYLHALLLDYGGTQTPEPGIPARIRDYLVRVVPGSDELLLGHAFLAMGRARIAVGWFALERLQPVQNKIPHVVPLDGPGCPRSPARALRWPTRLRVRSNHDGDRRE
jgi:hypothetical protein